MVTGDKSKQIRQLNVLDSPFNLFTIITPKSAAPITEMRLYPPTRKESPVSNELLDNTKGSTLTMMVSTFDVWETSSDVGEVYSEVPQRISIASSPSHIRLPEKRRVLRSPKFFSRTGGL